MTRQTLGTAASTHTRYAKSIGARDREWLAIGLGVAAVGWGANQFAPLLLMYRADLDVSAATVQATYGLYALGLIPGLLLSGPASDRYGRRRVLVPALVTSALASLLLMAGSAALGWLFVGRLVAGAASGMAFSSGTAWIKELCTHRLDRAPNPGARRATIAMTTGFAGGPLVAGLLAQWAPSPALSVYLPHLALTLLAIPLALRARETRSVNRETAPWTPSRLPTASGRRFRGVVLPLAPWVFGASSIALAYLPGLVKDRLGDYALPFGAVVTALTMVAGILVQPLARRLDLPGRPTLIAAALAIVAAGLLCASSAAATSQPLLVAAAALMLGAGYGCCLVAGLTEVQAMAGSHNLARLTAVFQAIAYLGFGAPYLLAVAEHIMSAAMLLLCTAVLAALTL
ncbi:MFS transporter, partial [Phytoactinopolyspora endophytica]|uniref:MFS transporter n=1 Tax=Phytoactinopolyspora endophytica TaxID=1642495 RepID=UPI0013ECC878